MRFRLEWSLQEKTKHKERKPHEVCSRSNFLFFFDHANNSVDDINKRREATFCSRHQNVKVCPLTFCQQPGIGKPSGPCQHHKGTIRLNRHWKLVRHTRTHIQNGCRWTDFMPQLMHNVYIRTAGDIKSLHTPDQIPGRKASQFIFIFCWVVQFLGSINDFSLSHFFGTHLHIWTGMQRCFMYLKQKLNLP